MNKPPILLVLGMHRSGSSAVAGLVHYWGGFCGEHRQLLPVQKDNPKGFWEFQPLVDFNEKLLFACEASWLNPPSVGYDFSKLQEYDQFIQEARELIDRMDSHGKPWFWKDPRLTCLMGFWSPLLEGRQVAVIVPVRNPLDIGASLWKRDRIPLTSALLIWQRSLLGVLRFLKAKSIQAIFVNYDRLLAAPEIESNRLASFLDMQTAQAGNKEQLLSMIQSVHVQLRHNKAATEMCLLSEGQKALHDKMIEWSRYEDGVASDSIPELALFELPEQWSTHLDHLRLLIEHRVQIKEIQERLGLIQHQLSEHQEEFGRLNRQCADQAVQIRQLEKLPLYRRLARFFKILFV